MLTKERIQLPSNAGFEEWWGCYESSFPEAERRPLGDHLAALQDERFYCYRFEDEQGFAGLFSYWLFGKLIYAEHFAIPSSRRGDGLGSLILKQFLDEASMPIILEIEPMEDDATKARWRFYKRLGFCLLRDEHWQPLYHQGDAPLRLRLLSYPMPLDPKRVLRFQSELEQTIAQYRDR
ncbi:MAG: GNAT family N-acetyltransferase [Akkermansia sp.]